MSSDDEALREKIAQALHGSRCGVAWEASHGPSVYDHRRDCLLLAAAVLPVVKEITDENKALRQEVREYRSAICFEQTCVRCATTLDKLATAEAEIEALREKVGRRDKANQEITDEVQRLRSVIDQATKLADEWEAEKSTLTNSYGAGWRLGQKDAARHLRRVLAVPETTEAHHVDD